jgi:hypothetical protein
MSDHEPLTISREQYLQLCGLVSLGRDHVKRENDLRDAATKIIGKDREDWISDVFWAARDLDEVLQISKVSVAADSTPADAKLIEHVVRNVCELPGYTSPEDQPELLMCTAKELEACIERAIEAVKVTA